VCEIQNLFTFIDDLAKAIILLSFGEERERETKKKKA